MSDILELETRRNIYNLINNNPGINLSVIAEHLNLSFQLVDYHLYYLKKHNLITVIKNNGYKRCYIIDTICQEDKQLLSILHQHFPLQIVLFLLDNPNSRYIDIMNHLKISSSKFSYHLQKLIKNDIVMQVSGKDSVGYVINNKLQMVEILIKYHPSFIAKKVKETWDVFR